MGMWRDRSFSSGHGDVSCIICPGQNGPDVYESSLGMYINGRQMEE